MPRLKSANNALTTLVAGIDNAATTFTVVDASSFPVAPFMVTVGDEIMEVGAIDTGTNTFSSVSRGQEGTTAAAHSAGDPVENRFTAGTHGELADQSALDNLNNTVNQHLNDYAKLQLNFIDLAVETETLKGAILNGVTANIFVETFQTLDDITLTHGVYDAENKRILL
jgi:hypothetical protein